MACDPQPRLLMVMLDAGPYVAVVEFKFVRLIMYQKTMDHGSCKQVFAL
jgi:hypothetical protein